MNIKPLHDKVLVKVAEETNQTASGLIIPDGTNETRTKEGEIISVGSGYRLEGGSDRALSVQVGDKVVFDKFGGTPVSIDGHEFLMMKEESIFGIIQ